MVNVAIILKEKNVNKKIIITIVILLSFAIGVRKYLQIQNVITSSHIEQNENNDNVVIQKVEAGSSCAFNAHCKSGNCQIGICEPCSDSLCNNDGQCCSEYTKGCINALCSNGDNGYPCNSNGDCNSNNCYDGFCVGCFKKAMLCTNDDQCCSPMSCLDGACFESLPFGRACTSNSECHSNLCINGTCSCHDVSCACDSNITCNTGNCEAGMCEHCLIEGGICENDGQCCNGVCDPNDGTCKGEIYYFSATDGKGGGLSLTDDGLSLETAAGNGLTINQDGLTITLPYDTEFTISFLALVLPFALFTTLIIDGYGYSITHVNGAITVTLDAGPDSYTASKDVETGQVTTDVVIDGSSGLDVEINNDDDNGNTTKTIDVTYDGNTIEINDNINNGVASLNFVATGEENILNRNGNTGATISGSTTNTDGNITKGVNLELNDGGTAELSSNIDDEGNITTDLSGTSVLDTATGHGGGSASISTSIDDGNITTAVNVTSTKGYGFTSQKSNKVGEGMTRTVTGNTTHLANVTPPVDTLSTGEQHALESKESSVGAEVAAKQASVSSIDKSTSGTYGANDYSASVDNSDGNDSRTVSDSNDGNSISVTTTTGSDGDDTKTASGTYNGNEYSASVDNDNGDITRNVSDTNTNVDGIPNTTDITVTNDDGDINKQSSTYYDGFQVDTSTSNQGGVVTKTRTGSETNSAGVTFTASTSTTDDDGDISTQTDMGDSNEQSMDIDSENDDGDVSTDYTATDGSNTMSYDRDVDSDGTVTRSFSS